MKLIKKILPIASTALIVSPIITSCSSNVTPTSKPIFSTTKIDFKPSSQHEESKYAKTPLEVAQEYFANPQYFIQDIAYERLNWANNDYIQKTKDKNISNVDYQVEFTVNSININEVKIKHIETDDGWQHDVYGAYLSLSLKFVLNRTHTRTTPTEELEKGVSKEVYTTIDKETYTSQLSNYFAFIFFDEEANKWSVGLYANKDSDWECKWSNITDLKTINKITRDGKEYTFEDETTKNQSVTNSRKIESDDFREILEDLGAYESYYLTNVFPKIINK